MRSRKIAVEIVPVGALAKKFEGKIPPFVEADGLTVREFLSLLPIRSELVAFVLVNGELVRRDHRLEDNDIVKLVPAMGGG